jgi:hypothetical protein
VLSRKAARPSPGDRFAFGVTRLVELAEGVLHDLPHDDELGTFERPIGVARDGDSPLYKAYIELFQSLFPDIAPI